jgi:bifunctional UDP-N-acetylglucosamine pyrophosphorylase/glucosamine-1-phosphate N-acetyltransferase
MLAYKVSKYFPGGYLKVSSKGLIKGIIEKPGEGKEPSKLVNIVVHYHPNPEVLIEELKKVRTDRDDRYECALQSLFDKVVHYKAVPYAGFWQPIKYPWHVVSLMNYFLSGIKSHRAAKVEVAKTAVIKGEVYLEDGVKVLDNAVIQGPAYIGKNSVIATNVLVRQSQIGENCVIGFGSEIARSYVGNNVWTHTNYVGDSVIGNDVSFGAGTVTGNLRLDEKNISVTIKEEKLDCGSNKFGLVTGDHVRVGVNTSFMPGVKVGSNAFIGAGIVVAQDVEDGTYVTGDWKLKVKENTRIISPRKIS